MQETLVLRGSESDLRIVNSACFWQGEFVMTLTGLEYRLPLTLERDLLIIAVRIATTLRLNMLLRYWEKTEGGSVCLSSGAAFWRRLARNLRVPLGKHATAAEAELQFAEVVAR